jgi:hypothetical protein
MAERQRLLFIDMFRGFAVVAMIQAHVSNATIRDSIQRTSSFHYLDIFNGTISGCFILIAGFAVGLYLEKKWDEVISGGPSLWKQVRRLLFVWFLGYWLHVPLWSLRGMLNLDAGQTMRFARVDVLMLIAFSLLLIIGLALVIRNRKAHALTTLALGLGVIAATPFVYDVDPSSFLALPLSGYLNNHPTNTALFPLFPFSAYAFLGSFLSWLYLELQERGQAHRLFLVLLIGGAASTAAAFALFYLPWSFHDYRDVAKASPRSFMMRFGAVSFMFALTFFYEQWRKPQKSFLAVLGQESLFVYAFHLLVVYGSVFVPYHLAHNVGKTLSYTQSFALSALLIIAVSAVTWGWHTLKTKAPRAGKAVFYGFWLYFFLVLLLR